LWEIAAGKARSFFGRVGELFAPNKQRWTNQPERTTRENIGCGQIFKPNCLVTENGLALLMPFYVFDILRRGRMRLPMGTRYISATMASISSIMALRFAASTWPACNWATASWMRSNRASEGRGDGTRSGNLFISLVRSAYRPSPIVGIVEWTKVQKTLLLRIPRRKYGLSRLDIGVTIKTPLWHRNPSSTSMVKSPPEQIFFSRILGLGDKDNEVAE